jgi:ribosomal protein L37AE/L43A
MATTDTSSLSPGGDPPDQQLSHNPTLPLYPSCTVCGNLMNPSTDRSESGIWLKRCKHCRDKFAKWRAAARKRKRDASTPATHSARRAAHQPQPPANQFISEEQPNIAQQAKSTSGLPRNEGFPRGVVQQPQQDAFHAEDVPIEREHPNDYGALLSYVWRAITTRLHDNNVSAKSLNASQFSFLLPTDATQNADLWEKLLWSPLTLTPAELNSIIR